MANALVAVLSEVTDVLERLRIPYAIGGSLASSAHGVARFTNDVDLVADVRPQHVKALADALGDDFMAEPSVIAMAVAAGGSFNLIHFDTSLKLDVFVRGSDSFRTTELGRRRAETLEGRSLYAITPEDTILAKLQWYRLGGETSERQWGDILGVLQVQDGRLDMEYLRDWAGRLGVTDLLERALADAAG